MATISQVIDTRRMSRGWTLDDLAAKSGCSWPTVQRACAGLAVHTTSMDKLLKALNLDVSDMLDPRERTAMPILLRSTAATRVRGGEEKPVNDPASAPANHDHSKKSGPDP
jgi:transcriptional regulator with XRE-family HTH domain